MEAVPAHAQTLTAAVRAGARTVSARDVGWWRIPGGQVVGSQFAHEVFESLELLPGEWRDEVLLESGEMGRQRPCQGGTSVFGEVDQDDATILR